jgi:hypothetical protein
MAVHRNVFDPSYIPPQSGRNAQIERLQQEIDDLEKCLAGNQDSENWRGLNTKLHRMKGQLESKIRSLTTHGPQRSDTGQDRP